MAALNKEKDSRITVANNGSSKRSYGSFQSHQNTRGFVPSSDRKGILEHHLESTDTLIGLSIKYDVSVEEILRQNKLWSKDQLHFQKVIKIPCQSMSPSDSTPTSPSPSSGTPTNGETTEQEDIYGRNIDSILQSADENLQKALQFQEKLSSTVSSPQSIGYQGSYPEVNFKSSKLPKQHFQSAARIAASPTPEGAKQKMEDDEEKLFEL